MAVVDGLAADVAVTVDFAATLVDADFLAVVVDVPLVDVAETWADTVFEADRVGVEAGFFFGPVRAAVAPWLLPDFGTAPAGSAASPDPDAADPDPADSDEGDVPTVVADPLDGPADPLSDVLDSPALRCVSGVAPPVESLAALVDPLSGTAHATPGALATARPTPNAVANAPTRPTCFAYPTTVSPQFEQAHEVITRNQQRCCCWRQFLRKFGRPPGGRGRSPTHT